MNVKMNVLVGRGFSAALSGISTLARRMDAAVDSARKDDGGFGAQAAMISGGLVAIGLVLVVALRDTSSDAENLLDSAGDIMGDTRILST